MGQEFGATNKNEEQLKERIGFEEISLIAVQGIFRKAPQGKVFVVPNEALQTVYEDCANGLAREDLKFEIGQ